MMEELFWGTLSHLDGMMPGGFGIRYKGVPRRFKRTIHAVNSTAIALIANCMSWAKHRRRKAAAKLHLRLNLQSFLPGFAIIEDASHHDDTRAPALCASLQEREIALFDKNPGVTGQIPVYLRMHPHTKIFYALRDPRDIAVSSFLRFLPMNNVSASYLKPDTAVAWIADELSLWQSLKPRIPQNQWQEVRYEDTVNDLHGTSSEALQSLGLEWDPAIENYRESRATRPVNSPTYLELTQPIHRKSLGRWQNYAFAFDEEFEKHADVL